MNDQWMHAECLILLMAWDNPIWRNIVSCHMEAKLDPSVPRGTTHFWIQSPIMFRHLTNFPLPSKSCTSAFEQKPGELSPQGPRGYVFPDTGHLKVWGWRLQLERLSGPLLLPGPRHSPPQVWWKHMRQHAQPTGFISLCFYISPYPLIPFISKQICM